MSEKLTLDVGIREIVVNNKEYEDFFDSILEQNALSPEQQTALGESIKTSIEKRDNMGAFLARLEGEAEMLKKEEKRLAERRRKFERIGEILTEGMHLQMLDWGVRKVEGQKFSFTVKKNPPSVEIEDESKIPAEYLEYTPRIKRAEIKEALSEGKEVEGAKLITNKTRLEIK
jgi:hypothetical protein